MGKYNKIDYSIFNEEILRLDEGSNLSVSSISKAIVIANPDLLIKHNTFRRYVSRVLKGFPDKPNPKSVKVSNENKSSTKSNDYKNKDKFVMSAWNPNTGQNMNIEDYCQKYNLPRKDITSYKFISHTGTPHYNIVFKENIEEDVKNFDMEGIISKHTYSVSIVKDILEDIESDFNVLTYTDVHVGMDTNKNDNSMYPILWNREAIIKSAKLLVKKTLKERDSDILFIDELGDLLDGFNAQTTRGGHSLPQNMTNEEAFDCALEFKMYMVDNLAPYYKEINCNNICNDNHAGSFGYFLNSAFKQIVELKYKDINVTNHRKFINHYFVNDICFVITHGKDDSNLKFGFKPQLDSKGLEKIDQYCKQNKIYKQCELIVFKKGDSHQALFDMCTSDDFYYFNYPALSPSSQWVQNNFKKGRMGFVNEKYKGLELTIKPTFIK
jgi:hypothetical protein